MAMSKKRSHKDQHFIPRSYLAAWCDPHAPANHEPYVHVFPRDGGTPRRRAPVNIFFENEMYTRTNAAGERDLGLEHWLEKTETSFANSRKEFLARGNQLPANRRAKLAVFIAALHTRTPAMRDHHGKYWKGVQDLGEEMLGKMKSKTPAERKAIAGMFPVSEGDHKKSMSMEQVRRIAANPLQELMPAFVAAEVPILSLMKVSVLCTDDPIGFITSDNPVTWFSPSAHTMPPMYRSPGFANEDLEITLPISPRQCLLLTHGGREPQPYKYMFVPPIVVNELNRRVRFGCHEHFVSQQSTTKPYWFDPGKMPDDAWEKLNPPVTSQ